MGYQMRNGRWADTQELILTPLESPITIDGYSAVVEVGDKRVASLRLLTTSASTDDTVVVTVETSRDGVTWYTAHAFTTVAATIDATWDQLKSFPIDRFVRAHYNVTGSGVSIACTLLGEAA